MKKISYAIKAGNRQDLTQCLKSNLDLLNVNLSEGTALALAIANNKQDILELLLSYPSLDFSTGLPHLPDAEAYANSLNLPYLAEMIRKKKQERAKIKNDSGSSSIITIVEPVVVLSKEQEISEVAQINCQYQYEDKDIQAILACRLKQIKADNIHILAAVNNMDEIDLKQRLEQHKNTEKGARVILIPCNLGNFHWAGIVLDITAQEQVQRAKYMDPLELPIPETFQQQIKLVYTNCNLEPQTLFRQREGDTTNCGAYTVENLVSVGCGLDPVETNAEGTRRLQLECLKIFDPTFYGDFKERQRENRSTVLSIQEQSVYLKQETLPSYQENQRLLMIADCLNKIFDQRIRENLLDAFRKNELFTDDHKLHLQAIRNSFVRSIEAVNNQEITSDCDTLSQLVKLLFNREWQFGTTLDDNIDFCVDYEELCAVANTKALSQKTSMATEINMAQEKRRLDELQNQLREGLAKNELENADAIEPEIEEITASYLSATQKRQANKAEKFKKTLDELNQLKELINDITRSQETLTLMSGTHLDNLPKEDVANNVIEITKTFTTKDSEVTMLGQELQHGVADNELVGETEQQDERALLQSKPTQAETNKQNQKSNEISGQLQTFAEVQQVANLIGTIPQGEAKALAQQSLAKHVSTESGVPEQQVFFHETVIAPPSNVPARTPQTQLDIEIESLEKDIQITPANAPVGQEIFNVNLNEIYERFNLALKLPECAEKSVSLLFGHFSAQEISKSLVKQQKISAELPLLLSQKMLLLLLKKLNLQVELEFLSDARIKSLLLTLERLVNKENQELRDLVTASAQLLKILRPVDFDFMISLIRANTFAAEQIRDKDIILLLGTTGAGKSTTIHFLAGSKMKKKKIAGLPHIEPDDSSDPRLKSFITSPYQKSETRSINAVAVQRKSVESNGQIEVTFCDTPGFGDTGGVEIDISNGISLARALQLAKSVKPVILISWKSLGDKFEGIIKLGKILVMLIPSLKNKLNSFSYVFTKVPENREEGIELIYHQIEDKRNCLTNDDLANDSLISLLDDLIAKTKNVEDILVIHPLIDNSISILDSLNAKPPIENPKEEFKDFANPDSLNAVKEQLSKNRETFKFAFERMHMPLAQYKFSQIRLLKDCLDLFEINNNFDEMIAFVKKAFDEKKALLETIFKRLGDQGYEFIGEDLALAIKTSRDLIQMEDFRVQQMPSHPSLTQATQMVVRRFIKKSYEIFSALEGYSVSEFAKMKSVVDSFCELFCHNKGFQGEIQDSFSKALSLVQKDIVSTNRTAEIALKEMDLQKFAELAEHLNKLILDFKEHLPQKLIDKYAQLCSMFSRHLEEELKLSLSAFEKISSALDLDKLQQWHSPTLEKITPHISCVYQVRDVPLLATFYKSTMQNEVQLIEETAKQYFEKVESTIPTAWALDIVKFFVLFNVLLAQLEELRGTRDMREKTEQTYARVVRKIEDCVRELNTKVVHQLQLIEDEQLNSPLLNLQALGANILALRSAEVFKDHAQQIYHNELYFAREMLKKLIDHYASTLNSAKISFDSLDHFSKQLQYLKVLKTLTSICTPLFGVELKSKAGIIAYETQIREMFFEIQDFIDHNSKKSINAFSELLNQYNFFEICSRGLMEPLLGEANELFTKVSDNIEAMFSLLDERATEAYKQLCALHATRVAQQQQVSAISDNSGFFVKRIAKSTANKLWSLAGYAKEENKPTTEQVIELQPEQEIIDWLTFLDQLVSNLSRRSIFFKEIANLETRAKAVLETWCSKPNGKLVLHVQKLVDFVPQMKCGIHDPYALSKLAVAQKLVVLDKLLPDQVVDYKTTALRLENEIKSQRLSKENELKMFVVKRNFESFKNAYQEAISLQPDLKDKLNVILSDCLSDFYGDVAQIEQQISGLTIDIYSGESLRQVLSQINLWGKITIISELSNDRTPHQEIINILERLNVSVTTKLQDYIKSLNKPAEMEEFEKALLGIRFIESLMSLLTVSTQNKLKLDITNLHEKIKKTVAEKNRLFSNLDIEDYSKNSPIEYFKRLDELNNQAQIFGEFRAQLELVISGKIAMALVECKKVDLDFDVQEKLNLIKNLDKFVPLSIYRKHDAEIKAVEADVQTKVHNAEQLCLELRRAKNMYGLVDALIKEKYLQNAKRISGEILDMIGQAVDNYTTQLNKGNLKDIVQPLSESWDGWQYYCFRLANRPVEFRSKWGGRTEHMYLVDPAKPNKICTDFLLKVSTKIGQLLDKFNLLPKYSADYDKGFALLAEEFANLVSLFKLGSDYQEKRATASSYEHLYASLARVNPKLGSLIQKSFEHVRDFINSAQEKFDEILKSTNLEQLRFIMQSMRKYDDIFTMIKDFAETKKGKDSPLLSKNFSETILNSLDYSGLRTSLAKRLICLQETASQKILEHKKARSPNSIVREQFYREISDAFITLKTAKPLIEHVDEKVADVNKLELEAKEKILKHLYEVRDEVLKLIQLTPTENAGDYDDMNTWYDNLRISDKCFENNNLGQSSRLMLKELDKALDSRLKTVKAEIAGFDDRTALLSKLIYLKLMSVHAPTFKDQSNKTIDFLLDDIMRLKGAPEIASISLDFKSRDDEYQGLAHMIIAEHSVFRRYAIKLRNEETLKLDVSHVLNKLEENKGNDDCVTSELRYHFDEYESLYWRLVEEGLVRIDEVKQEIRTQTGLLAKDATKSYKEKVVGMTANLFAYWTLMNSSSTNSKEEGYRAFLLQPHAAQIIGIFRLLGLDVPSDMNLTNHLIEIGTGEGKSVTIAITAMILALQGYDVDCACYSQYLSDRDYADFIDLFSAFGLRNNIVYGTFNYLCERLVNQSGEVRNMVVDLMKNANSTAHKRLGDIRQRIILIDEVDVFFNREFYGSYYRPLVELKDPTIHNLLSYVWDNRENKAQLQLSNIKNSDAYRKCCERFSGWDNLIFEAVKAMITDVRTFDQPEYVVVNDQIGYREQHGISFDISYRYKTLFAYFFECERYEVTEETRNKRAALIIDCGAFSYAELPKRYKCVMGLSGTLHTLSLPEMQLLTDVYKINKFTYMPSVYGANQLQFAGDSIRDVIIDEHNAHFVAIVREIKNRRATEEKRPVIVFFESNDYLKKFYESQELERSGLDFGKIRLITEELPDDQKSGLISQATSLGIITLLTRGFGRGTDFKCYDRRVDSCGGVHVIQTFVSDELSEETQIKGRTARQGKFGSYSMVLISEDLERYQIKDADLIRMKNTSKLYTEINESRCKFFIKEYEERLRFVSDIESNHNAAMDFIESLFKQDLEQVKDFLLLRNTIHLSNENNVSRTICLMDATGSMSALLLKAKNTVHTMFEQACNVLTTKGMDPASFELQFVAYRNYTTAKKAQLLEISPWESSPDNLRQFIDTIAANGGTWMEEAIEVALQYANQEAENGIVNQVILIGDAPPNQRKQVTEGRAHLGENHWKSTRFANPTYYEDEVSRLKEKEIPVHAFFVDNAAKSSFEYIANSTGGKSQMLDIDSREGAELLTQVITERILDQLGGSDLVELYREKFVKGYISTTKHLPVVFSQDAQKIARQGGENSEDQTSSSHSTKKLSLVSG